MSTRLRSKMRGRLLRPKSGGPSSRPSDAGFDSGPDSLGEALLFGEPADTLPPTMSEPAQASEPAPAEVALILPEAMSTAAVDVEPAPKLEAIKVDLPKIDPVKIEAEPVKIEASKDEAPTIVEAAVEEKAPQLITIARGSELSETEAPPPASAASIPVPSPSSKSLSKKEKKKQKREQQAQKSGESLAPRIESAPVAVPATSTPPTVISIDTSGDGIEDDPVSLQFFRSSDSVPPFVDAGEAAEEEEPRAKPPSAEQLAHRAKLRRVVMGVVAAASLVVVLGLGKSLVSAQTPGGATPADARTESAAPKSESAAEPAKAEAKVEAPKQVGAATEAKADEVKVDDAKKAEEAKAAEEAKKAEDAKAEEEKKKADDAKAEEEKKKAEAPTGDVKELKKKATIAINRGDNKATVEAANAALAADPSDALMYLYLGTAYMNMGKAPDAREAFNECMRKATTGPKWECSAMGGRK